MLANLSFTLLCNRYLRGWEGLTFFLVDTKHDHNLVASDTDELLDTTNTSSRQFGEQDHSVDVVVFEELDVRAHFGDLQGTKQERLETFVTAEVTPP